MIDERDYPAQVWDWPVSSRTVTRMRRDYTVALPFDGDAGLVRASLITCTHNPSWTVHGQELRAAFTFDLTTPGAQVRASIDERAADAEQHLDHARGDIEKYHEDLNTVVAGMVAQIVAIRAAGQRQRQELGLPFAIPAPAVPGVPATIPTQEQPAAEGVDLNAIFENVIEVLRRAATELPVDRPMIERLTEEQHLRSLLIIFLKASLPEYTFTAESFRGQGKVDILVHWSTQVVCVIECKIWHSRASSRAGIDQVLSYLLFEDTRVA